MLESKIPTDVFLLSGTGASITTEIQIPRKKRNKRSPEMFPTRKYPIPNQESKSPAMYPSRNYPIPNQDSNRIITQKYPIIPPLLEKYPTGYKPLFNDAHYPNKIYDDLNNSTENSRTDMDYY